MRFMTDRSARALLLACAAAPLAACSWMGPSGAPPAMPAPAHYGAAPQPADTAAAQGVAQHFETGARPVADWWTRYRSPALDALVAEGLQHSPSLEASRHTLASAREQLRAQIRESLLPSVDAGGQATRERALGIPGLGSQTVLYDVFMGQLQASYTLDLFGAARFANRALAQRVDVTAFQLEAARRTLAANVVSAVITAATLHAQIDTTERSVALAQAQADDAAARYRLGAIAHSDLLGAQQNAASLAASLPALRQQHDATRHALAVLLGRTPDQAPADLPLADLHLPEAVPVVVPSELLRARPDIRAADAALKASAAEVGVATAQLFPQISLSASLGQGGFSWASMLSGAGGIWSIGASVTQPIFHAGALLARRHAAQETYAASVEQYKQTVLTAFQDVADSLNALDHDEQTLDASNRAAEAAHGVFADTAVRVELGALPPSAARSAELQYCNARLDEIRATGARLSDTAHLYQAMGMPEGAPAGATTGATPRDGA